MKRPIRIVAGQEGESATFSWMQRDLYKTTEGERGTEVVKGLGQWFCVEDTESIAKSMFVIVEKVIYAG